MTLDPSKLRDRLRAVVRPAGTPAVPPAQPVRPAQSDEGTLAVQPAAPVDACVSEAPAGATVPPALPARPARTGVSASLRASESAARVLGGAWREHGTSRSFVVTRRYEAEAPYGRSSVGEFSRRLRQASEGARLLATGQPRAPFVFFDLETTGLSGGAGTHAFLVGCAWFDEDDSFVVEQHLMTDYAAERGMLTVVAQEMSRAGTLVTYNGKSFDAPVIETRYLFHRLTSPCTPLPHVDVLHPARRFWGGDPTLGCSLIALEQQVFGRRRVGDVPGFEIPERYFQFVRTGDAQPLADVFEHNRLDLVSLAGLTARLLMLVQEGADAASDEREALALGKVFERAGEPARAEAAWEHAVRLAVQAAERGSRRRVAEWAWTPQGIRVEALRALAMSARRTRRYNDAASRWRQVLEVPGCPAHVRREATEALAIHHEHRDRDLAAARLFALKSLETGSEAAWGDAVRHRLARIERKMVSERSLFPSSPSQPPCGSPTSGRRTSS